MLGVLRTFQVEQLCLALLRSKQPSLRHWQTAGVSVQVEKLAHTRQYRRGLHSLVFCSARHMSSFCIGAEVFGIRAPTRAFAEALSAKWNFSVACDCFFAEHVNS